MAGTISAVSWFDGNPHLRVYTATKGQVTEQGFDGSWYTGQFSAPGYSVGATSWLEGSQIHIRVYVSDRTGKITEQCWDGNGWYVGAYQGQGTAAATSWLDAGGQVHIRVYARTLSGTTEQCWDGNGWYVGAYTGPGTTVAAETQSEQFAAAS